MNSVIGALSFSDFTISLSKTTERRIWNGKIRGFETLNHELQHGEDFASGIYSRIYNAAGCDKE